jgi:hypothetical protein
MAISTTRSARRKAKRAAPQPSAQPEAIEQIAVTAPSDRPALLLAAAVLDDLADPNHPFWNMGMPGLSRQPDLRFDKNLRRQTIERFARIAIDFF